MNKPIGTLYIVGTPIGNLDDMSPRAINTLKDVSLIAAEDTRHTRKLLSHFDIHTPLDSYHKFNEKIKIPKYINFLVNGKDIAIVSNAGMPGISDPGELLIKEAIKNNIPVVPIPGPCALILALAVSGLSTERFVFEGFLPRKKTQRLKTLYPLKEEPRTMIFYETGPRLSETISNMNNIFGNRHCVIARELTKKFEETRRGDLSNILSQIPDIRGEFVILVEGAEIKKEIQKTPLKEELENIQKELGISAKEAIKLIAARYDIPKRNVYSEWIRKEKPH